MFKVEFKTDNAAFDSWPEDEITNILIRVSHAVNNMAKSGPIVDKNGIKIGEWKWEDGE